MGLLPDLRYMTLTSCNKLMVASYFMSPDGAVFNEQSDLCQHALSFASDAFFYNKVNVFEF